MEEFFYVLSKYLKEISINESYKFNKFLDYQMINLNKNIETKKILEDIYSQFMKVEGYKVNKSNNNIYALKCVFSDVNFDNKIDNSNEIYKKPIEQSLAGKYIYPSVNGIIGEKDFITLVNSFINEINICKNEEQKFYVFKKFFSSIPAKNLPNCYVSLFNTAKIISAFFSCIKAESSKKSVEDREFLLVKGDVSGIQEFIFSISSKTAAKSLKGRSVYINFLTNIVSKYIVKRLGLSNNNILYNGGGNFYIIIPKSKYNEIIDIRNYISKVLLKAHKGKIYIAIEISGNDLDDDKSKIITINKLKDCSHFFNDVSQKTASLKNKKWSDIDIEKNFKNIFGPVDNGNQGKRTCNICGSILNNLNEGMCTMCKSFTELTNEIKGTKFYYEKTLSVDEMEIDEIRDYKDVFKSFGFEIEFTNINGIGFKKYLINGTDFLKYNCDGYIFKSLNLPEDSTFEKIISFNNINSNKKLGDKKLGALKLDVDNLGKIFLKGLKSNHKNEISIGETIELSDAISLFFEGYLNELIKNDNEKKEVKLDELTGENWDKVMYVVYAGGDDTFILGAYNEVFEFSYILRKSFEKYVCSNKNITFSAGIGLFSYKYPVVKCAYYTEQFLDKAKIYTRKKEELPQKDSVCLFDEIFTWNEFEKILEIRNLCINIYEKSENRAFLQKILNSTKGFKAILSNINTKKKIQIVKVHRLAYYLRELKNTKSQVSDIVERLVKTYEKMVVDSILSKSNNVCNIMVIPAAVRWAELNTKKVEENDE